MFRGKDGVKRRWLMYPRERERKIEGGGSKGGDEKQKDGGWRRQTHLSFKSF